MSCIVLTLEQIVLNLYQTSLQQCDPELLTLVLRLL
jgi:hypothetical protein